MQNLPLSLARLDTMPKRLQYLSENYPNRELFVFYQDGVRDAYTARQLFQLAGKFANRLRHKYGFQPGDIIANTLPNSPERLVTDTGTAVAGCTGLNGQILLADGSDFIRSAKYSTCRTVIMQPEVDSSAWRLLYQFVSGDCCSDFIHLACPDAPEMTSAILVSRTKEGGRKPFLEDLRESDDDVFLDTSVGPNDLLYVFVTSGSTGYSKLVPRTHAEMFVKGDVFNNKDILIFETAETVVYNDRNLGWFGGFTLKTYTLGQKRVLLDWFDGHEWKKGQDVWTSICREKCTIAMIRQVDIDSVLRYTKSIGGSDFKLKTLSTGGQPLTKAQLTSMFSLADSVSVVYGSTEAGALTYATLTSPDIEHFYCGKIVPGVELKVIDENGEICKPRQEGTVLVKGEFIFRGYFNRLQNPDPQTIKCFTKDGWFDTEDVGFLDEDGNVYIMGRNKDTITYGSMVLYPGWLEARIMQHSDVSEACIVPVSDPVLYQNICACVKKTSGSDLNEDKLKKYCESIFIADLASEQTPMPEYFMVLDDFPATLTGKTDKKVLVKMAEERFGAGQASSN